MVEIRGAQRPVLAIGVGLVITVIGLFLASKLNPDKGNPQKECTATQCTVNFPAAKQGNRNTGVGSIVIFGVPVHMGDVSVNRAELGVGAKTLYIPMGFVREAGGMQIELKRTASDGAIIVFRKDESARN